MSTSQVRHSDIEGFNDKNLKFNLKQAYKKLPGILVTTSDVSDLVTDKFVVAFS